MKLITALKIQQKNKNKVNVFLDNTYFCSLAIEVVVKNNLKPNMIIDETLIEKWQLESEKTFAYEKALKLISTRYKTQSEVEEYLKQKGYLPSTVFYVIKKLLEYDFINDERYAESFVYHKSQKEGVNKIKQQLFSKGIKEEIIDKALKQIDNQSQQISVLAEKYMKNKDNTKENLAKLYRYLMGKGFTYDDIKQVIKGEDI